MFDTGQAARVLGLKSASLAHLLLEFCSVIADKKNQLADWRQRPLPEQMLHYAREDTHYLLYIHDILKQKLKEKGDYAFSTVLRKSQNICYNQFEKPVVKDFNYFSVLARHKHSCTALEVSLLKFLMKWRDFIARKEDESIQYVMPNHVLF